MDAKNQRRRFWGFLLIAFLVTIQVGWWTTLFVRNVNEIESLQIENHGLAQELGRGSAPSISSISREALHKRFMFISESLFFFLLTGAGLYLLYRALRFDEKTHDAQKNFIEILTHESKTPLTAMKLRLEALLENQNDDATRYELKAGLDEIRTLSSIVEKTLNLNRMEREALVKELVCVADVVRDLTKRLDPFFKARNVKLELLLESDACVLGDLDGIRNSFQSVIENSILYNEKPEKKLQITLWEESGNILLRFVDNGPGISLVDREMIFEKFYRGRSRSKTPGTGLGLYIARSLLKAHHGIIRSVPSAVGAVFEVSLPVAT